MDSRSFACSDGSYWTVTVLGRTSPYRLAVVFESRDAAPGLLRGEVSAPSIEALSDDELCFLVNELRA